MIKYHRYFIYYYNEIVYGEMDMKKSGIRKRKVVIMLVFLLCIAVPLNVSASEPPVADANGPYIESECTEIWFDASGSYDPDGDDLAYRWDFDNDGEWDTDWDVIPIATHMWLDDFSGTVRVEVTDGELSDTAIANTTIMNINPIITNISGPADPVEVGAEVELTVDFFDGDIRNGILSDDTHIALFEWDDINTTMYDLEVGETSVTGSFIYQEPGVYTVMVIISDDDGGSDWIEFQYVVIYDPNEGFVTGGGWIESPPGAFIDDPELNGSANFGFISKYKKGHQTPSGNTEFNFQVANLNFHSRVYDWLVIAGPKAMYKGVGKINFDGNFGFLLTAIDGDINGGGGIDKFRIKIWDKDDNDRLIYDNMLEVPEGEDPTTILMGGKIQIHKK